jgi:hypothetical protein
MSTLVKYLNGRVGHSENPTWKPVTLHSAQGTSFVQPTAIGGGADVTGWINEQGYGPDLAAVDILGTAAATITGPLALYAERRGKLYFVGQLNYGLDIVLQGAEVGWSGVIAGVGGAERLLVGGISTAALISTGSITVKAYPIATKEEV